MIANEVIVVDAGDNQLGVMEKMQAHTEGVLHRAFSIFLFNKKGEMLLQQRSIEKYHSGGLWTNACCSHPMPGEETLQAANRRLKEEMGFSATIEKAFDFIYKAELENGLTEHEFDHVFTGEYEGVIDFNKEEVMDYCYKTIGEIRSELDLDPGKYTVWFHIAFPGIEEWWLKQYGAD